MLNAKQEKFINNIVSGMSQRQAYKDAYQVSYSDEAIDSKASTLFNSEKVQIRYRELMSKLEEEAIMSAKERMIWLTEVIRDKQLEVDDIGFKPADLNTKMKAVDILNKMSGEYITKVEAEVDSDINVTIKVEE